jgi:integrase
MTGWRLGECTGLTWDRVDWERRAMRLSRSQTKGKHARYFPFTLVPGLKELLEEQWRTREGNFVFHNEHARNDGGRIMTEGSFYTAWRAACRKAALTGRTFHDLRRTAAMNFSVRGFEREEIMALCGWKTDAMFTRYNIVDAARLLKRAAQLAPAPNGNLPATSEVPPPQSGG